MRQASISARGVSTRWLLVMLAVLIVPEKLPAQTAATKSETAAQAEPAIVVPLGRYVPKENLIVYVEFAGLNAHNEAWKKTAACKMLYDTPLGGMLEEVSAQLLDKVLSIVPDKKVTGAEIVTLFKNAAQSGFVLGINANPKDPSDPIRGTFVLRGAANKPLRAISGRLMGWLMGTEAKPKIEFREGRPIVFVPFAATPNLGWAWWAEKNDLVVASRFPVGAEMTLATLDGKNPSALDHPIVQELSKPEGTFQPVYMAFIDTAGCPDMPNPMAQSLRQLKDKGILRLDVRWGFDDDALVTVARLIAPKPRKLPAAVFDQPTFDKTSLLPLPDGVESFVELSLNPAQLFETINGLGLPDEVKAQIDEFTEEIQNAGKIDLQKDLLARLGPRMSLYLAPGRSAATTNEESSLETVLGKGLNPMAAMSTTLSLLPKFTLVAEVKDPVAFGKALDALINAINTELKSQAKEKALQEEAQGDRGAGSGGAARAGGRNQGAGGDRTKRRREETPAPVFRVAAAEANSKATSFVLHTPSASPLRFGPPSFRPTIHLEGKYLAFSLSTEAAHAAITAVNRKNWTPSATIQKATAHVPSKLMLLMVSDMAETLPSLLANLPGTLQTAINTSIALARSQESGGQAGATGANRPGGMGAGPRIGRRGGPQGAPDPRGGGVGAPSAGNFPGAPNSGTTGPAEDAMIQFKIDADKLPKAEDLKSYLFAETLSVTASDQDIRFVSREAFPNLASPAGLVSMAVLMPALKSIMAGQAQPQQAPTQAGASNQPPAAGVPGGPAGGQPQAPAGEQPTGPGGRRRRAD
jgi:hypothetical protein